MKRIFLTLAFFGLFPFFLFIGIIQLMAGVSDNAVMEYIYVLKDIWKPEYRRSRYRR